MLTRPLYAQILSQHESSISLHLDLVNTLKDRVGQDNDVSQTISSIISSTKKLMEQIVLIRKQFVLGAFSYSNACGSGLLIMSLYRSL